MVNMKLNSNRDGHGAAAGWHPADIIAAVRRQGTSLQRLSLDHGFSLWTMNKAVRQCFPACHDIIASLVGVPRQRIWPQFYAQDGQRLSVRAQRRAAARIARRAA